MTTNEGANWIRYMTGVSADGVELEYFTWKRHAPIGFRRSVDSDVMRVKSFGIEDTLFDCDWCMIPVGHEDEFPDFDDWVARVKKDEPKTKWAARIDVEGFPDCIAMVALPHRGIPIDDFFWYFQDKTLAPEATEKVLLLDMKALPLDVDDGAEGGHAPHKITGDFWKVKKDKPAVHDATLDTSRKSGYWGDLVSCNLAYDCAMDLDDDRKN